MIVVLGLLGDPGVTWRVWLAWAKVMAVVLMLIGQTIAATYVFDSFEVKGVGYRSHELIGQTQSGQEGQKFVEKISGTGNFVDRTEFELDIRNDSINFTQEAEFQYFPVSYQSGTYDQKWMEKICVINYDIGAVLTEAYNSAESLQKTTEIRTIGNITNATLQANLNADVVGVAHIGWVSRTRTEKRIVEIGRSVEDLTGTFSVNKFVDLSNCSGAPVRVDWMPSI